MMSPKLLELERSIRNLSLAEQHWHRDRFPGQPAGRLSNQKILEFLS